MLILQRTSYGPPSLKRMSSPKMYETIKVPITLRFEMQSIETLACKLESIPSDFQICTTLLLSLFSQFFPQQWLRLYIHVHAPAKVCKTSKFSVILHIRNDAMLFYSSLRICENVGLKQSLGTCKYRFEV